MFLRTIITVKSLVLAPLFFALFAIGLFLPANLTHAQTLDSTLQEAVEKVDELRAIENSEDLSDEEREQLEILTRKEAMKKILSLTILDGEELKAKLDALDTLNEEEEEMRATLRALFEEHIAAYEILRTRLEETNNLEEIKQLASDFKNWRKAVYDPRAKNIVNFTLIFRQRAILDITQNRFNKIESDLEKLQNAKLMRAEDTATQLKNATRQIQKAKELNAQALEEMKQIIYPFREEEFDENEEENTAPEEAREEKEIDSADSEIKTISANPELEEKEEGGEESEERGARELIEESLNNIKSAYQNFIEISGIVRKKLGME